MSARKEIHECARGCECVLLAALVVVACPVRGGVRGVCCGVIGAGVCGRVWACVGVCGRVAAWGRGGVWPVSWQVRAAGSGCAAVRLLRDAGYVPAALKERL